MKPVLRLEVMHQIPSWNAVLAMEHWGRQRLKKGIQFAFLSALRVSASDCSTKTTSAKNTLSIAAATLESYQLMLRRKRESKRANSKLKKISRKALLLKFGK